MSEKLEHIGSIHMSKWVEADLWSDGSFIITHSYPDKEDVNVMVILQEELQNLINGIKDINNGTTTM